MFSYKKFLSITSIILTISIYAQDTYTAAFQKNAQRYQNYALENEKPNPDVARRFKVSSTCTGDYKVNTIDTLHITYVEQDKKVKAMEYSNYEKSVVKTTDNPKGIVLNEKAFSPLLTSSPDKAMRYANYACDLQKHEKEQFAFPTQFKNTASLLRSWKTSALYFPIITGISAAAGFFVGNKILSIIPEKYIQTHSWKKKQYISWAVGLATAAGSTVASHAIIRHHLFN